MHEALDAQVNPGPPTPAKGRTGTSAATQCTQRQLQRHHKFSTAFDTSEDDELHDTNFCAAVIGKGTACAGEGQSALMLPVMFSNPSRQKEIIDTTPCIMTMTDIP